jgi:hypothetical protein
LISDLIDPIFILNWIEKKNQLKNNYTIDKKIMLLSQKKNLTASFYFFINKIILFQELTCSNQYPSFELGGT